MRQKNNVKFLFLPILKYAALMASDKTLKIPCIESTENLKMLIKEELSSLFPTGLKTIISLGKKLCQ